MKALFTLFASLALPTLAHAQNCIAHGQDMRGGPTATRFTIEEQRNGTILKFDSAVAWEAEALSFEVVYTGYVGELKLVAARATAAREDQLVEILFENSHNLKGTMKAGDRRRDDGGMAKFREYTVECDQD